MDESVREKAYSTAFRSVRAQEWMLCLFPKNRSTFFRTTKTAWGRPDWPAPCVKIGRSVTDQWTSRSRSP